MNDYCLLLDTDIEPLIGVDITTQRTHHELLSMNQVNPDLLVWLDSMGVTLANFVEVFHWGLGESGGLHVDFQEVDFVKLNWVYGGDGSTTNWYEKNDPAPKEKVKTVVASDTFFYTKDEVTKAHEQHVVGPCILQVGVPHQVVNSDKEHRHTLCFVPRLKDGSYITMSKAKEIFAPFIKQ